MRASILEASHAAFGYETRDLTTPAIYHVSDLDAPLARSSNVPILDILILVPSSIRLVVFS